MRLAKQEKLRMPAKPIVFVSFDEGREVLLNPNIVHPSLYFDVVEVLLGEIGCDKDYRYVFDLRSTSVAS